MNILKLSEWVLLKIFAPKRYLPMQIDITNACNLKCTHCYHSNHLNRNALSAAQWMRIIDDYFKLVSQLRYKPMIAICGGEPTISPHFIPLLQFISGKMPETKVVILTNGTSFTGSGLYLVEIET